MKWMAYLFCILAFTTPVFAQEFNAGFVQGLWYSQKSVFAEQPIRVYVAIRNNTGSDLTGTVEFFDNEKKIDRVNVSALDGRIIESWTDWTPKYGSHTLSATLSRIELHTVGSSTKAVTVTSALAEDIVFADYDTDNDGVGNEKDIDDDGDGISDEVEIKNGTDPLVYTEPPVEPGADSSTETDETTNATGSTATGEGLEQYLTPSRADSMLTSVTNFTQAVKENLDTYRAERRLAKGSETIAAEETPDIEVNEDGFGKITRTTDGEPAPTKEKSQAEKPGGFFGDIITFFATIIGGIYGGILATISWTLGHPILVQLLLLVGILFGMFKAAQKLGGRPS